MHQRKMRKRLIGGALAVLVALFGVLVCARPARAAGDAFTVVNHLVITLNGTDMDKSTIEGPSIGTEPLTFSEANQLFLDAGNTGTFVNAQDGVITVDFQNASVKKVVNGEEAYFGLGHMLLGDPWNTLFKNGNAITVQGSGTVVFKNLDVSILPDSQGSGTTGGDKGANVSHGLLDAGNSILSVGSGCNVTLGDGVDIDTSTPSDNGGNTVACGAILATSGGTINIGAPAGSAQALADTTGTGAVIDGTAGTTGTGRINVYRGIVTNAGTGVTAGAGTITATVGGQKIIGSSPMNLTTVSNVPAGPVTVTEAPANAQLIVSSSTTVQNSSQNPISVGAPGAEPEVVPAGGSGTPQVATAKETLQLAVDNAQADYPASDSGLYTATSWKSYQDALAAAQSLLGDASVTDPDDPQYTQAAQALQTAIAGLVRVSAGTQALSAAIAEAQQIVGTDASKYPADGWAAYQAALQNAQDVLSNPSSTQADMNGARKQLQEAVDAIVQVKVTRLLNPNTGEHLFTSDQNEVQVLMGYGWQWEGIAWNAPAMSTGTPIYRLYNPNNHDHLYTDDANEYAVLQKEYGWQGEDVQFYSATTTTACPVYRLYLPGAWSGTHLWTTDKHEYDVLPDFHWVQEDIAFYALTLPE